MPRQGASVYALNFLTQGKRIIMANIISDAKIAEWETQVFPRLKCAWRKLKLEEELFISEVGERSLTHRFAVHLDPLFEGWNVDCEYNRIGSLEQTKKIMILDKEMKDVEEKLPLLNSPEAITVFPDISVHRRGFPGVEDNLLVIEVKKSTNKSKENWDLDKLKAYVNPEEGQIFAYRFGLFLKINLNKAISKYALYEHGTKEKLNIQMDWD